MKKQIDSLKNQLAFSLSNEEKVLKLNLQYRDDIAYIDSKYKVLEKRYLALKNSKLGRITTLYWRVRKKLAAVWGTYKS